MAAFYLDLDWFKPVNDEFGHDVGDELLAAVARRLESCTRPEDLVARLGGDEFAVLIDTAAAPDAIELVAARLAGAFDDPFAVAGQTMIVGASIGRAMFPDDAHDRRAAAQHRRRGDVRPQARPPGRRRPPVERAL